MEYYHAASLWYPVLVWQMLGGFFPVFPATVRLSAAWSPAVVPAHAAPQHPEMDEPSAF